MRWTEEELTAVRPSPRQIRYQQRELIGFVHFTVNTFTDREWGDGTEDPAVFNPDRLDAGPAFVYAEHSSNRAGNRPRPSSSRASVSASRLCPLCGGS